MNYFILFVYFILSIFSNGNWIFPVLVWISPIFLVRYIRKQKPLIGLLSAFFVYFIAYSVQWKGMIPLHGPVYFLVVFGIAISFFIPFIIDRLLYKRLNGALSTLILPLSAVIIEFIYVTFNPYGDWGIPAMTQVNCPYLIQIVTITGAQGITFLVYWFVSLMNWMWENGFDLKKLKKEIIIFSTCMAIVLVYGFILVRFFSPDLKTVRIASVSPASDVDSRWKTSKINDKIYQRIKLDDNELDQYRRFHSKYKDELFEYTEKEAAAGAKIIVWPEFGVWMLKEDKNEFLERCRQISAKYDVYLLAGVFLIDRDAEIPYINLVYFTQPDGKVIEYIKTKLVPGDYQQKGDGKIFLADTSYGKISSLICFDTDFPSYVKRVKDADILLVPGNDWKEIDPYHTAMEKLKAVEFGLNIVRHATKGLSAAYDYRGNVLSTSDYFTCKPQIMVANVPTRGIVTVYSILGDWFVYLCAAAFIALILIILKKKKTLDNT